MYYGRKGMVKIEVECKRCKQIQVFECGLHEVKEDRDCNSSYSLWDLAAGIAGRRAESHGWKFDADLPGGRVCLCDKCWQEVSNFCEQFLSKGEE